MKKYFVLAASAAVVLGSSCSNEEISEVSALPENGKKAIEISAYAAGATRFDAAQAVIDSLGTAGSGFFVTAKYTKSEVYTTLFGSQKFFAGEGGVCSAADNSLYYWPDDMDEGTGVDFYAYYSGNVTQEPCTLNLSENSQTMNISLKDTERGNFDIMAASASASSGSVELKFEHLLAQVKVNVKYDEAYAESLEGEVNFNLNSLKINAPSSSVYTFAKGTTASSVSASDDTQTYSDYVFQSSSVSIYAAASEIGVAMIPASSATVVEDVLTPQTECTLSLSYSVSVNGNTKDYNKSAPIKIAAGYLNNINITVSGSNLIKIKTSVDTWKNQSEDGTTIDF